MNTCNIKAALAPLSDRYLSLLSFSLQLLSRLARPFFQYPFLSLWQIPFITMAKVSFFKNYRVYLLTAVAYMGSLLFAMVPYLCPTATWLARLTFWVSKRVQHRCHGICVCLDQLQKGLQLAIGKQWFDSARNAQVSSSVVSLLTAGCFFGAIAAAFLNDHFGRRFSLVGFSVIFLIGAAIQTAASHSIGQIYAGRVVSGFQTGGMSSIIPVFVVENAVGLIADFHRGRYLTTIVECVCNHYPY